MEEGVEARLIETGLAGTCHWQWGVRDRQTVMVLDRQGQGSMALEYIKSFRCNFSKGSIEYLLVQRQR